MIVISIVRKARNILFPGMGSLKYDASIVRNNMLLTISRKNIYISTITVKLEKTLWRGLAH